MVRYATRLSGDPANIYRTIDVASRAAAADPHQLVEMLYEEIVRALESAAWAIDNRDLRFKADRVTRATAIFFALENGLDYDRGGDVAHTLGTLYRSLRQQVIDASIGNDPAPFRSAAATLSEIATAWSSVRAS